MTNSTEHEPINLKELNLSPTEINAIRRCAKHQSIYKHKAATTGQDRPYANAITINKLIKRGILTYDKYAEFDGKKRFLYIFTPYGIRVSTALGLVKDVDES